MAGLNDAVNLYIAILQKYKELHEKQPVELGFVYNGGIYVNGMPHTYESVSPNRFVEGDVVYVAQTEEDGKVVVLG